MATTSTSSKSGTAQFLRVLLEFKRDLSQNEIEDFSFMNSTDLKKAIIQLQDEQKANKRMQNLRRLSAFVEAMDQFDKVIHVFLNASDYLGFIWGPAKFMLLIAGSYSEALNMLLDSYQEIGEHMPLLGQYESQISNNPYLQEIVGLIFKDILTFHHKAMKHFRQRAWKKIFHATWRTFRTDFGAIISNLQSHRRLLDSQAIFSGVTEIMKTMEKLRETRAVIEEECSKRQIEDDRRRRLTLISWLSAANSMGDHEDALSVQRSEYNNDSWLFEQSMVKEWMDPCFSSKPLLWVSGRPGVGKTILASTLIEKCRSQSNTVVAYFYCRHADPSRNSFLGLAQSLILQFTRSNPSLLPYIVNIQATSDTTSLQSAKIAKEVLGVAVASFENLILIVDGLDECSKAGKKEIVEWIRASILLAKDDNSRNLRCCFFGQEDNDAGKLLKGIRNFQLTEKHNRNQITSYCESRAKSIGEDFDLSAQDIQNLTSSVCKNTDGMFLYAKLVMDNLAGQVSKAGLYEEMETIPPDINQLYDRIIHQVLNGSSPAEQLVVKTLLSWLLCAKRPLKWYEIQGALSLDLDSQKFDPNRRLHKDIKQLCGSLVEIRRGDIICFVHLTAKCFLERFPGLPRDSEHINLTRRCFAQLSLISHASDASQDSIRDWIIRGEYAFTEYSIVYVFDHLIDVLSTESANLDYDALRNNLRNFVTSCVDAPENHISIGKSVDSKLKRFRDEIFYNGLKHAIAYHRRILEASSQDEEEDSVLGQLQQFEQIRKVLESITKSRSTPNLHTLYGDNLFKCTELRCKSFHDGFSTQQARDKHHEQHERTHICPVPECVSAVIGFNSSARLQKHENDYHKGASAETVFPWNGRLGALDINSEIRKGNQPAFDLWLSQCQPDKISDYLEIAASKGQLPMIKAMLEKCEDCREKVLSVRFYDAIIAAIDFGSTDMMQFLLSKSTFGTGEEDLIFMIFIRALRSGRNVFVHDILRHKLSPFQGTGNLRRRATCLNLAIRFGRQETVQHILETYKADPSVIDERGRTSLIAAAEFDRSKIAQLIIRTTKCNIWGTNKKNENALSMAGRQGNLKFISLLFNDNESEEVLKWRRTAELRNAARSGDDAKVRTLLGAGSLNLDEKDMEKKTPFLWALEGNHHRVVELLLGEASINSTRYRKMRNPTSGSVDTGPGALHRAALSGTSAMMQTLLQSGKFDTELSRDCWTFGGKVKKFGVSGTPLNIAAKCKNQELVQILSDYGQSLESKSEQSVSPIDVSLAFPNMGNDSVYGESEAETVVFDGKGSEVIHID